MISTVHNRTANSAAHAVTLALDDVAPLEDQRAIALIDPGRILTDIEEALARGHDHITVGTTRDPRAITITRLGDVIAAANPSLETTCLVTIGAAR